MIFCDSDRQQLAQSSTLQRMNDAHGQHVVTIVTDVRIKNQRQRSCRIFLCHSERVQQAGNEREQDQVCFHSRSDEATAGLSRVNTGVRSTIQSDTKQHSNQIRSIYEVSPIHFKQCDKSPRLQKFQSSRSALRLSHSSMEQITSRA